ncbi:MAG: hypothetical protein ABL994_20795, partial [Verrucomicrobiales bacterium]
MTLGTNLGSGAMNHILDFLSIDFFWCKQIEVLGVAVIQIENTESTSSRQKKTMLGRKPGTKEVTF